MLIARVCRPSKAAAPFIFVIVKFPFVQIGAMIIGVILLVMEFPLPFLKNMAIYRSFISRIVLLLFQSFLTILYYQVTLLPIHILDILLTILLLAGH